MSLTTYIESGATQKNYQKWPYWAENEGVNRPNSNKNGFCGDILDT